jgi:hypothetical protein
MWVGQRGVASDDEAEAADTVSVHAGSGPGGPRSGGALCALLGPDLRVDVRLSWPSACGRRAYHLCKWTSQGVNATDLRGIRLWVSGEILALFVRHLRGGACGCRHSFLKGIEDTPSPFPYKYQGKS